MIKFPSSSTLSPVFLASSSTEGCQSAAILPARCKSESCRKTFEAALAQIEAAVREHGATVEELVVRVKSGAISEARFGLSRKWCRSARHFTFRFTDRCATTRRVLDRLVLRLCPAHDRTSH
jgi:hypothetical protein